MVDELYLNGIKINPVDKLEVIFEMNTKIPSFQRNHNELLPGLYLQEVRHNIAIYDLRFIKPNKETIPIEAMHSIEHLCATYFKIYSGIKDFVISFNPGACQTMFYLEVLNDKNIDVKNELINFIEWAMYQTEVPGAIEEECGNYKSHNLKLAKLWLFEYYKVLLYGRKTN